MKIAFVCDWLTGMRGGERCLEAMCELYPNADIFTLVHFPGCVSQTIESHNIRTSLIQKLPAAEKHFRKCLPFFPRAIERFDLGDYDFVLSFSHCVAKGVKASPDARHVCYCYTPVRYAWHMRSDYLRGITGLKRAVTEHILDRLKQWDRRTSDRVTHFIAISRHVQDRIRDAYCRDSTIIYPPVDCSRFSVSDRHDNYYLVVSALVPYKRVDLTVAAFAGFDRKLVVVGSGPELSAIKNIASPNITFVEHADDDEVVTYMKNCRALLFPGEEDFGIVPLEAQACGKPVIAFGKGGALETVVGFDEADGDTADATGVFFYEQTPQALQEAILAYEATEDRLDPSACRNNALKFDRPIYKQSMQRYINSVLDETP